MNLKRDKYHITQIKYRVMKRFNKIVKYAEKRGHF